MLQYERNPTRLDEAILVALRGWQRGIWTAMPGIVQSTLASDGTISVQPTIQGRFRDPAGTESNLSLPLLVKVPVVFPSAGGFSLTFPIASGDEVLVVFASRCIDAWWQQGGVQPQIEFRAHNLSDGFAIPGPRSAPRAISSVSAATVQLRSDDGQCVIEIASGHKVNITAPGGITVTGAFAVTGDLHVSGAVIAGYGGADQVGLQTHTHSDPQGGNVSAPNAGT